MSSALRLLAAGLTLALMTPSRAAPAEGPQKKPVVAQHAGCPAHAAFGGLPVRSVDVKTPLAFLPWIQADLVQAKALAAPLAGTAFNASQVNAVWDAIGKLPFAGLDLQARVGGDALLLDIACPPEGLELTFFVYSMKVSTTLGITWEARQRETAAPEQQSGQEALRRGMQLLPRLGYQAGEGAGAGASARYNLAAAGADALWRSMALDGYVSGRLHDLAMAVEGGRERADGTWAHTTWRLAYADQSAPARSVSRLGLRGLEAQVLAQTHPLGTLALPVRLGAALAAGQHRSSGQDDPAAGLAADQRYQSLKLMAGTTARLKQHSFAASYGIELGAGNGGSRGLDWVKQVVDLAHEGRWRVADHRSLSVETRLSLGQLSERGAVPHSARFFAGGREQWFTGGAEWQIRAAPLLRSLGTNMLAGLASSPGYRRFMALNLTAAVPVLRKPLVPAEVYRDPGLRKELNAQLNSTINILAGDMRPDLPTYRLAIGHLPEVQQTLAALRSAVGGVEPAAGSAGSDAFAACTGQLVQAEADVAQVLGAVGIEQLGFFTELLPGEGSADTLAQVVALCVDGFNKPGPQSPQIAQQGAVLRASIAQLSAWFAAADPAAAEAAARREIEPVRLIVDSLMDEINAVAVSPLLMLDVVNVGPRLPGGPRARVGMGSGLRVTLVDSVDISLGYMVNMRRQAGEARGAFFLTMQFKDPF